MFMWLVHHGKLMTNHERTRLCLTVNPHCQCCPTTIEDLDHVFKSCSKASVVWLQQAKHETVRQAHHMAFQEWLRWNLNQTNVHGDGGEWKDQFAILLWWLWRWRNESIFNKREATLEAKVAMARHYSREVNSVLSYQSLMKKMRKDIQPDGFGGLHHTRGG